MTKDVVAEQDRSLWPVDKRNEDDGEGDGWWKKSSVFVGESLW